MVSITLTDTDAIAYLKQINFQEEEAENIINLSVELEETKEALDYALSKLKAKETETSELKARVQELNDKYSTSIVYTEPTDLSTPEAKLAYSVAAIDKDIELESKPIQFKPTTSTKSKAWTKDELLLITDSMRVPDYYDARKLTTLIEYLPNRTESAIRSKLNSLGITVKNGIMQKI